MSPFFSQIIHNFRTHELAVWHVMDDVSIGLEGFIRVYDAFSFYSSEPLCRVDEVVAIRVSIVEVEFRLGDLCSSVLMSIRISPRIP